METVQEGAAGHRSGMAVPLELRYGPSLLRRSHMMLLLAPVAAAFVLALPVLVWNGDRSFEALASTAWGALTEGDPWERFQAWAAAVLAPLAVIGLLAIRAARLRVSTMGLQGHVSKWSGFGLEKLTTGHFSVPWERIESVSLYSRGHWPHGIAHLKTARLVIRTGDEDITLAPFNWVAEGGDHRLSLGEAMTGGQVSASEWLSRSPLVQALRARGFTLEHETGARAATRHFDLARHPGMVTQMIVMALAGGYALVDTFVTGPYRPMEPLPVAAFLAMAGVGGGAAAVLGRGAPAKERLVVGILAVAALVAAVHPAMMRLNGWTGAPQEVPYTVSAPGRLHAPDAGLPDIDLSHMDMPEYWEAHPPGTAHPMVLVKGAAGFRQWDQRPLLERVRAFYADR